jgi:hypothetical protein
VKQLSWGQVLAWRLRRHHLAERAPRKQMLDVVRSIGGLHAQVMSSAELTLWARVEGLRPGDLSKALWEEHRLIKTWAMRGTLHLLPADELPMWVAGFSTYDHYLKGAWLKAFGMTREELERLVDAVGEALDGEPLTRAELGEAVSAAMGDASLGEKMSESWGAYLKPAAFRGRLCFAPDRGRNVCFTRPDRFVKQLGHVEPDVALADITRRWLRAYGPGTREGFARWWGLQSAARAGKMLDALGDEVVEVEVAGKKLRMLGADADDAAGIAPERSVLLVPGFDQWVVGAARGEAALLDPAEKARVYRQAGWISAALLLNGRIEGVWRHERKGKRLTVELEPFGKLPAWARRAAEQEAERLRDFLGGELSLSWI